MCCHCMNRRTFLGVSAAMAMAASTLPLARSALAATGWPGNYWDPEARCQMSSKALKVQPVLMYSVPTRREMASWKSWGGIQTDEAADQELARIAIELTALSQGASFPIEVLPPVKVRNENEAAAMRDSLEGEMLLYPATGSGAMLRGCIPEKGGLVYVREKSGPVYYWYEALSTRYLRKTTEPRTKEKPLSVNDVVVDDARELLWRLQSVFAVRNLQGCRVVAIGGAAGKYAEDAPEVAREKYKLEIVEFGYDKLGPRIEAALKDETVVNQCERWTDAYLALANTKLETERSFVVNAFVLYGVFKDILKENDASVLTIQGCMGTILPMSRTTACLTLSLMNDEGLVAFCESDFVIIPPGILLHYISGRPVFMHNSTFPHNGTVTCAHCTAPRRMDGARYEPVRLLTHYESEYGAAPKVEMPIGQQVTCISPEYATGRWVGLKGTVESNPFYEICRSQQDIKVSGNWRKLLNEVRDSHWMMAYGDYLREIGYAADYLGITWDSVEEA